MDITKRKFIEVDYEEFEIRILADLVPKHIPMSQAIKYFEGKRDKKRNEEESTNQYSEQESQSTRITEVCSTKNI